MNDYPYVGQFYGDHHPLIRDRYGIDNAGRLCLPRGTETGRTLEQRRLHQTRARTGNPITQQTRDEAAATRPLTDYASKQPSIES